MQLSAMLAACLCGPYTHVENSGDFRLVRTGCRLWIYFAHSDGAVDWKNNLDFPARVLVTEKPQLLVHRGFLRVWRSIEPHVRDAILDARTKSVVTVGYSHGAALALLAYDYVLRTRPDLRSATEGYGFGAPRVLWGCHRKSIRERFSHFTVIRNIDDIVTHLPPVLLGYFHAGELLAIGKRGRYSAFDAHRPENILYELRKLEEKERDGRSVPRPTFEVAHN